MGRWRAGADAGALAARWCPHRQHRRGLVSTLDLLPTLLAAARAPAEASAATDGIDQLGLLRGETSTGHAALHRDTGWSWAVREGPWKLGYVDPRSAHVTALRDREHAEVGSGLFLADLSTDPGETTDLAPSSPDVVERLARRHRAWRRDVSPTLARHRARA